MLGLLSDIHFYHSCLNFCNRFLAPTKNLKIEFFERTILRSTQPFRVKPSTTTLPSPQLRRFSANLPSTSLLSLRLEHFSKVFSLAHSFRTSRQPFSANSRSAILPNSFDLKSNLLVSASSLYMFASKRRWSSTSYGFPRPLRCSQIQTKPRMSSETAATLDPYAYTPNAAFEDAYKDASGRVSKLQH